MIIIPVFLATFLAGATSVAQKSKSESFESVVRSFQAARALEKRAPDKACAAYEKLKSDSHDSLARLAAVRRSVVCPEKEIYEPRGDELSWLGPWIKEAAEARTEGLKKNDPVELRLRALYLLSQLNDDQDHRLDAIDEAMKIAVREKMEDWQERLEQQKIKIAPRFTKDPGPADYRAVLGDYFHARAYDAARAWLKDELKKPNLKPEDEYLLKLELAQSYKREQKRKANLRALKDLFAWAEKTRAAGKLPGALFHEALTLYTRALWTNGNREGGARILKKYHPRFEKEEAAEIAWILARMEEEARDYEGSNFWAAKAAQQANKGGELEEKALFLNAWNLKKMKAYPSAIEAFEKLAALPRRPHEVAKYHFWLGWLHQKTKSPKKAEPYFDQAADDDPFGYYGILSVIHREKKFPPLKLTPVKDLGDGLDETAIALVALKEKELLKRYLDFRIAQWDAQTKLEVRYAQARALADVGSHLPLFRLFTALEAGDRWKFFRAHSEAVFPRKFTAIIEKAAKERGLPPELLFSIIRQESTYDPEARSIADAMGLMQVLATQGPALAKRAGVKYEKHDDLYVPEINIPLGSLLMSDNFKKMSGNILLTAAAYNANPASVFKWIRARSNQSFIEFIEEIPYEETRTYMKLVLRNFVFYRRLQNPDTETATPEECLRSLQFPKKSTPKKKKR